MSSFSIDSYDTTDINVVNSNQVNIITLIASSNLQLPYIMEDPNFLKLNGVDGQIIVAEGPSLYVYRNGFWEFIKGNVPPSKKRKINFTNSTTKDLDLYLTVGNGGPGPTKIQTLTANGGKYNWFIPLTYDWSGNFTAMPKGANWVPGGTIAEFGFNQLYDTFPKLRDTFDISIVPPGIGNECNWGPREDAVSISQASGYSVQQSYGYNVGIKITPPSQTYPPSLLPPGQTVFINNSAVKDQTQAIQCQAITYPNDCDVPKQQTIDATAHVTGDYQIEFIEPVVQIPSNP